MSLLRGKVILVGCVKTKLPGTYVARDLYTSPLFRKRRAYADASGYEWYVLSAAHGIVPQLRAIRSYDFTIGQHVSATLRAWRTQVERDLRMIAPSRVELHAGAAYAKALQPVLDELGIELELPLEGMGIGEQLAWYGRGE